MRNFLKALLPCLLLASLAGASNYVYDNGPTPGTKTQRKPVINPTQEMSATEFNQVTGALKDLRTAINDGTPMFNIAKYGAVCDGVADDTAAIQATLDAAEAYFLANGGPRPVVQLKAGTCRQSYPIFVPQAVTMQGFGKAATSIYPFSSFRGYNLIIGRDASTGAGPAHQNAFAVPGQMSWTTLSSFNTDQYFYDLAQLDQGRIPTNTSWTMYFRFKPLDTSGIQMIWDISGGLWANQSNPLAAIGYHPGSGFLVQMRYNGLGCSAFATFASPPTFTNGVEHTFELSYDQSTKKARFFVDGQKWTNGSSGDFPVDSGCGGARVTSDGSGMLEYPWEAHAIGPSEPLSSVTNTPAADRAQGTMRDLWFSSSVRHTSSYTPPAAGSITSDGNTLLLLKFDRFYKGALIADWGIGGTAYIYPELAQVTEAGGITLKNFMLYTGSGLKGEFTSGLLVEDVIQFGAQDGWRFDHNGYFSRFRNVDIVASVGRSAFHNSGGSYVSIDNSTFANRMGIDLNSANIFGSGNSITVHTDCLAGMIITGGGVTDLTGTSTDAEEASTVPWLGAVVISANNNASVTLRTPTLYGPTNKRATDPVVQVHIDHEDTGPSRIYLESPYFAQPPTAGPVVLNNLSFGSGTPTWTHPIILANPTYLTPPYSVSGNYDQYANTTTDAPANVLDLSPSREQRNERTCAGVPDGGNWRIGNTCVNTNPLPSGYVGYVCTDAGAGSACTWKGYGAIAP